MPVIVDRKVGETYVAQAANGHLMEYVRGGFWPSGADRAASSWDAEHSEKCGCWTSEDPGDRVLPDW